jgi:hypothetical protein
MVSLKALLADPVANVPTTCSALEMPFTGDTSCAFEANAAVSHVARRVPQSDQRVLFSLIGRRVRDEFAETGLRLS